MTLIDLRSLDEQQEQWVGLAYVERHGLPGHPPARPVEYVTDAHRLDVLRMARRARARQARRDEWGEV